MRILPAICVLFVILPSVPSFAAELHVKAGTTDWTKAASYTENTLPTSSDTVVLPEGGEVTVGDSASFTKVNTFYDLKPTVGSTIVFDVPSGSTWTLDTEISAGNAMYGTITKRGEGELTFNGAQTKFLSGNVCFDYYTEKLLVEAGTLRFKQNGLKREMYYGHTRVDAGATLILNTTSASGGGSNFMYFRTLTGAGTVSASQAIEMRMAEACAFAGRFEGQAYLAIHTNFDLTGTESTMTTPPKSWIPTTGSQSENDFVGLGITKIGSSTDASSSIGATTEFYAAEKGGGFRYLGTGETTDKLYTFGTTHASTDEYVFFDAGANGGVTFTGVWRDRYHYLSQKWTTRIFLLGSNRTECVMNNELRDPTLSGDSSTVCPYTVTKRGSGAWRFAYDSNTYSGSFSIDEGTLRFDSLVEKGEKCALGTAANLLTPQSGLISSVPKIDYAFRLGEDELGSSPTEGTFEYSGSLGVAVGTRSFGLKGNGRLLNNTATCVRYAGVKAVSSGAHTLTLDGTGTAANEIVDVTDGDAFGTVSVVKTGKGQWQLGGETSFSGSLSVEGGTLVVNEPSSVYTWFLLSIYDLPYAQIVNIGKLGLYDGNGARLNGDLKLHSGDYTDISRGECAYRTRNLYNTTVALEKIFKTVHNQDDCWQANPIYENGNAMGWDKTNPKCWFHVVMRLTNTVEQVASYDLWLRHGRYNNANNEGATSPGISASGYVNPKTYTLYGSTDGLNWETVHKVLDSTSDDSSANGGMSIPADKGDWSRYWLSSGEEYAASDATCHKGHAISGVSDRILVPALKNVSSVKVSNGATLKANGSTLIAALKNVTIDCSSAESTIEGFAFAEEGVLNLVNYDSRSGSVQTLPVAFSSATDLANVGSWSLTINGTSSYSKVAVRGDHLVLSCKGSTISIR